MPGNATKFPPSDSAVGEFDRYLALSASGKPAPAVVLDAGRAAAARN